MPTITDSLFPKDINEIYNNKMIEDTPFVESIISSIKFQIHTNTLDNLEQGFEYDAEEWLFEQDLNRIQRVTDRVIKYFRDRGIRCSSSNGMNNFYDTTNMKLNLKWFNRNQQEFMKAYYN